MTEPTDAELQALWSEAVLPDTVTKRLAFSFARAVLAKWGTPPVVAGEPNLLRAAAIELRDAPDLRAMQRATAKLYAAIDTTPQPTQAQTGAVPLTDEQWQRIADLTDSILTRATKDEIERVIGIKGGQHGESV